MAIAFDATSEGSSVSGTTQTINHTCSGDDRLLLTNILTNNTTTSITSLTYNGTSCSQQIVQKTEDAQNFHSFAYGLVAPSTGTNSLTVTFPGSSVKGLQAISYTGVAQTGFPDAKAQSNGIGNSWTSTVTTVADNCWHWVGIRTASISTFTSGTRRLSGNYSGAQTTGDTNGVVTPAGSSSITGTSADGNQSVAMSISFAPASAGGANTTDFFRMF